MSSEWISGKLGDFVELKRGYDLPQAKRSRGEVPLVSSSGVSDRHDVAMVKGPGVITGRYGTIGQVFYVEEDFWPLNTTLYVRDFKGNNRKFINYFLKTLDFHAYSDKAAVPGLNRNHLHEALVTIPPVSAQAKIAEFLGALDDRITLLRETNTTLEAIAQALFKSWFVDFDPVHAKMQGRAPEGMDEATAALFPDSFEDSELGKVPKGWRIESIYEVAKLVYGAPFASKKFKSDPPGKPLVRIRDLKDERPGVYTEEVHPKGYLLQPGDIAVGMDGEFRAYVWGGEEAWLNQRICVFQPINGANSVFVRLSIAPLLASVEASETATTVIHLGKNDIDRFKILHPGNAVLNSFGLLTTSLYERVVRNKHVIQNLGSIRDTLLPRLISGQLRIKEAKQTLQEAEA